MARAIESYRPIRVFGGFRLGTVTDVLTAEGWESEYEIDWTLPVYTTEAEADRQAAVLKASLFMTGVAA